MPKAKGKNRRQKYSYNVNRKRLYRSARRRAAPRIACSHIRHAWDSSKSVAQNLAEMGLAADPNKAVPIPKKKLAVSAPGWGGSCAACFPPWLHNVSVLCLEMEYEASLPEKKSNTLSRDLIDYVWYMIQNHGENYKEMARDEKNYYQDTPKQIKRKINVYKNFYPEEYKDFVASLKQEKMDVQ
ncbi:NOP16 protein, partial [Todus mexicanus]|nr:NOP16 protein [Todus mexicanus]